MDSRTRCEARAERLHKRRARYEPALMQSVAFATLITRSDITPIIAKLCESQPGKLFIIQHLLVKLRNTWDIHFLYFDPSFNKSLRHLTPGLR